MKRTLLAVTLLVVLVAVAPAQSKYSASLAFDLKGKATPVVRATLDTYRSKLSFLPKGFAVDLDAFTALQSDVRLGFGLTHTWTRRFEIADRFAPTLGLTAGPWLNYGTGSGKLAGGLYVGVGASW